MGNETTAPIQAQPRDFRKFSDISPLLANMISQWKGDVDKRVEENRILRRAQVDVAGQREKGNFDPDETYISVRTIDLTLDQKKPEKLSFLVQSRRLAVHVPELGPAYYNTDYREAEFTRVLKYEGWELDYIRWLDAADLHGWGWMRCEFDEKMPGMVRNRYIETENLFFDRRVKDIQTVPILMLRYPLTRVSFQEMCVDHPNFDPRTVSTLTSQLAAQKAATEGASDNVTIYEVFFKQEGIVWRGWYSPSSTDTWTEAPSPYFNGVSVQVEEPVASETGIPGFQMVWKKQPEKEYPFVCLFDRVTEDTTLSETEGQAQRSFYKQDAASSLMSSFVNACMRASKTMWAPKTPNQDSGGQAPKQLSMKVQNGAIWESPMEAFHTPWPDPMLPKALEVMEQQRSMEEAQIAWGVQNRKDSRKTATENMMAGQQQSQMSGVSTLMFSISLTRLFNMNWRIVQSVASQSLIMFCADENGKNNVPLIQLKCIIRAAGDIDFVQRNALISQMQQDWEIYGNTPLAQEFLRMYTQVRYPVYADRFLRVLDQSAGDKQLIQSLSLILKEAVTDEHGQLRPEFAAHAQQLQQIQQMVQQSLGGANNGSQGPSSKGAAAPGANATANQGLDPATGTPAMVNARANAGIAGGIGAAAQDTAGAS